MILSANVIRKISKMHDAILFVAIINSYMYLSFPGYRFVKNAISWLNLFSVISHRFEQVVKHIVYQKLTISNYIMTQILTKYSYIYEYLVSILCIND